MNERSRTRSRFAVALPAVLCLLLFSAGVRAEDATQPGPDAEFGGQILTLTEPQQADFKSDDPRFRDNKNGTVTDLQHHLVWEQRDSYQSQKKWLNWNDAQNYIKKFNETEFGGASTWRLPTREELQSLYDENKSVPWNYYWTKNEVHIDPIFGNSSCCYWSIEELSGEMAWGFNYIRGKAYPSMKGGIQKSLTVIRAVRDLADSEKVSLK
ncbi:Lcl C-terminal domain-containing protein [Nitrospina watsonii]|uniref:Lcl C-terminal domain-containing protein n=1 Tax=Nitrospina watsonii TaxID=1323948 RepID=A0ABM9HFJ0_9BACT|nr:DUF1566 domain-containing protein [Nitrospina watsonii]CAI2719097.1 conserved exported protein of unknown function [Nitrospina watsonii]